jgi:hypothetical protein
MEWVESEHTYVTPHHDSAKNIHNRFRSLLNLRCHRGVKTGWNVSPVKCSFTARKSSATATVFHLFLYGCHQYCAGSLACIFRGALHGRRQLSIRNRGQGSQFRRSII